MILIVDDEKDFAQSLERFLRFTGLDAVAVNSSTEALALINTRKPSLIVLDLTMPDIDGMTLLRAVRKDQAFRNVPILVYTDEISRDKELEALNAGAQDFIVKGTVTWPVLLERIRDLLGLPKAPPPES
jgi:DNA-binding response OmpR family regulator